ncbi:transcriptional regulator [Caulobacter flavus]|jgi:DNA-binding transcriptional ArsR family regulator|uniref:Transcriptional regulator n=1 Tax=Caulobacter flavus TaxID=1679497 RepID=A0A2N5CPR7_9CAUL|nr:MULTISPECIES: metalloregulator ArsR/SmtB family transcription factor [Caulobacter]PLR09150.1 transcriptional regulator [Caulobacter flavus]
MPTDVKLERPRTFDVGFFRALCEPVRLQLLTKLVQLGRADVATISEGFGQDRSVISRHLQILRDTGVVTASREGRHVFYELDGRALADKLQSMSEEVRALSPLCCPGRG